MHPSHCANLNTSSRHDPKAEERECGQTERVPQLWHSFKIRPRVHRGREGGRVAGSKARPFVLGKEKSTAQIVHIQKEREKEILGSAES